MERGLACRAGVGARPHVGRAAGLGEGRRSLFGRREYQREGCATARRLADMNAAFVRLHDFVDYGEPKPAP